MDSSLDRSIHVVIAAVAAAAAGFFFVLGHVGDQGVGGQEQRADAGGVLQGGAVTLVGSMMPALTRSVYSSFSAS